MVVGVCAFLRVAAQQEEPLRIERNYISAQEYLGRKASFSAFDIEIDSLGYAYMVGDRGCYRFDGNKLIPLYSEDGKRVPIGVEMFKDAKGRLWVTSPYGAAYLEGDTLHTYPLPDSLIRKFRHDVMACYQDSSGVLHLGLKYFGYYKVFPDGAVQKVAMAQNEKPEYLVTLLDGHFPFFTFKRVKHDSLDLVWMDSEPGEQIHLGTVKAPLPYYGTSIVRLPNDEFLLSNGTKDVFHFSKKRLLHHYKANTSIIQLFRDSKSRLWAGSIDRGFAIVHHYDFQNLQWQLSGPAAVLTEDEHGGLWFSSDSMRFGYLLPEESHLVANQLSKVAQGRVWAAARQADTLFLINESGELFGLHDQSILQVPLPRQNGREVFARFVAVDPKSQQLWITLPRGMAVREPDGWQVYSLADTLPNFNENISRLFFTDDGSIYGVSLNRVIRWQEGRMKVLSHHISMFMHDIHVDAAGNIWVVSNKGVFQFNPESKRLERPFDDLPKDLKNFTVFMTEVFGRLWVQCYSGPLYELQDSTWVLVEGPDGKSVSITEPDQDEAGNYYTVVRSEGLGKVFKISQQGEQLQWQALAYDDESTKAAFFGFQVAGDRFLVSSGKGVFLDSLSHLKPQEATIRLHLAHLLVNHEPANWKAHHQLQHDENNLNLAFNGISYRLVPIEYRYRLLGLDTVWQYTGNQEAQYTNLFPGDYQFEVQARHKAGQWTPATTYGFSITPPYWETWWFRSGGVVLGLALLYLLFQWRLRQLRFRDHRKAQVALEMSRLEMKALKAQLNPHFIFNAMGSLSYYLSHNQPQKAEEYLQRFARLIRGVLDNSEESSVPLPTEIELMRHYVVLEAERFGGGGIDFEISVEGFDPAQVMIPPALFQPYLENAIWHGLQPQKGARYLQLRCEREGQQVKITVEDNGIGRAASAQRSDAKRKKRSYGMMIASRRIETWNQQQTHQLAIEDLRHPDGSAAGTRVVFFLPLVMATNADQPFSKRSAS